MDMADVLLVYTNYGIIESIEESSRSVTSCVFPCNRLSVKQTPYTLGLVLGHPTACSSSRMASVESLY